MGLPHGWQRDRFDSGTCRLIQVCEQLDPQVEREVGSFLQSVPETTGACQEHDPRWLHVLKQAMGHKPVLLIARENGPQSPICGYLPLALVASRIFGRYLVSLPYLNRAGVVADDPQVAAELVAKACELSEQRKTKYLELRHGDALEHASLGARRADKFRMVLDLPEDDEALFKAVGPKVRNLIRKSDKQSLSFR